MLTERLSESSHVVKVSWLNSLVHFSIIFFLILVFEISFVIEQCDATMLFLALTLASKTVQDEFKKHH